MDYNITYRDKNGSVQAIISYKDSSGRWKQKSKQGFKNQKSAKPWISDTVEELEKTITYLDPVFNDITFKTLFEMYKKHSKLYKEKNTIRKLRPIENHFNNIFDVKLTKIKSLDIQECVDELVKKKLKTSTINDYVKKLKTIFSYAIKHKAIKDNPVDNITVPVNKEEEKIKALNKAEIDVLLSKIKNYKYYVMSLIAVTCGLRFGEIMGLTWADVDEKKSQLNINKQWKLINDEPMKYGFGTLKTKNSNRIVPIPHKTLQELKKYKQKYPINISNRLFPYKNTYGQNASINNYYKKLGYDTSIHDLRHTYATTLIANGLDFKTAAELLGHDVDMTIKIYSHVTSDMMERATSLINTMF